MKDGPNIARIAALLGDPARAEALTGLMVELLMGVAFRTGAVRLVSSPREPALRNGWLTLTPEGLRPSESGILWFRQRRSACRPCLDWSERRHHLAGSAGAALLSGISALGWAKRDRTSRVVRFTARGEGRFRELFA